MWRGRPRPRTRKCTLTRRDSDFPAPSVLLSCSETRRENVPPTLCPSYRAFELVDMRVGRVTRVEEHPRARKPAYKLWIDFGPELGVKTSSAQIVANYSKQDLMDRLVVCAVNLGVRNIAGFASEVLTMGMSDSAGNVVLLQPASDVPQGSRVF